MALPRYFIDYQKQSLLIRSIFHYKCKIKRVGKLHTLIQQKMMWNLLLASLWSMTNVLGIECPLPSPAEIFSGRKRSMKEPCKRRHREHPTLVKRMINRRGGSDALWKLKTASKSAMKSRYRYQPTWTPTWARLAGKAKRRTAEPSTVCIKDLRSSGFGFGCSRCCLMGDWQLYGSPRRLPQINGGLESTACGRGLGAEGLAPGSGWKMMLFSTMRQNTSWSSVRCLKNVNESYSC